MLPALSTARLNCRLKGVLACTVLCKLEKPQVLLAFLPGTLSSPLPALPEGGTKPYDTDLRRCHPGRSCQKPFMRLALPGQFSIRTHHLPHSSRFLNFQRQTAKARGSLYFQTPHVAKNGCLEAWGTYSWLRN